MKKIVASVFEKKTKEGKAFNSYAIKSRDGEGWITVKFTKDAGSPKITKIENYKFIQIEVDETKDDFNIDGKGNIWIKNFVEAPDKKVLDELVKKINEDKAVLNAIVSKRVFG
jgi:hypothetical protein